jgi:hypothetical protein
MNANTQTQTGRTTQKLLTAVIVLQSLTLLGQWTGQPANRSASAAIPDPGAQREAMVEQQKATNEKLDRLLDLLNKGELKVKVVEDKK